MYRYSLIFKLIISGICLIALFLLFYFSDRISPEDTLNVPKTEEMNFERDAFKFNPEELVYDGVGEIDLLEGVSLEGFTQEEIKQIVFVRIYTDDNLSNKTVEYTADTEEGRIRSTRPLRLVNYNGPEIKLPDEMPSITMSTVDHMSDLIKAKSTYKADDGFGNDVREHVQIDVEKSATNSAEVNYTFVLENAFGDRTVAKAEALISDVPATIILTESEVFIRKGEMFYPLMYIESAVDSEGQSIIEEVRCDEINTDTPGEYTVNYELRGQNVSLRVIVME